MTIHTEIGFDTGTYTVTRPGIGEWVSGRFVRPAPTTFTITATESVGGGLTDDDQPQGQETQETRTLYTDTELFASRPSLSGGGDTGVGQEADTVEIDGGQWIVTGVKHHKIISGHYVATVQRLFDGEAA